MSASLPASVDAERMVAGRRSFEGVLPVAELPRLVEALADDRGEVTYRLDFEQGELGGLQLHVVLSAGLTLDASVRSIRSFIRRRSIPGWACWRTSRMPTRCRAIANRCYCKAARCRRAG